MWVMVMMKTRRAFRRMGFRGVLLGWRSNRLRLLNLMRRCCALAFVFLVYSYSSISFASISLVGSAILVGIWMDSDSNNYYPPPFELALPLESRIGLISVS